MRADCSPRWRGVRWALYAAAALVTLYYASAAVVLIEWASRATASELHTSLVGFQVDELVDAGDSLTAPRLRALLVLDAVLPVDVGLRAIDVSVHSPGRDALIAVASIADVSVSRGHRVDALDAPAPVEASSATLFSGGARALANAIIGVALGQPSAPTLQLLIRGSIDVPLLRPFTVRVEAAVHVDVKTVVARMAHEGSAPTTNGTTAARGPMDGWILPIISPATFADAVLEALGDELSFAPPRTRAAITAALRDTATGVGPRFTGFAARAPAWMLDLGSRHGFSGRNRGHRL